MMKPEVRKRQTDLNVRSITSDGASEPLLLVAYEETKHYGVTRTFLKQLS